MSIPDSAVQELTAQKYRTQKMEDFSTVISEFFELAHLQEIKEMLKETLQALTQRNYAYKPGSKEYDNTLYFFERLENFIDAAYLVK